jgi:hypothetical protein
MRLEACGIDEKRKKVIGASVMRAIKAAFYLLKSKKYSS